VLGPSFGAAEIPGVVEAILDTYRAQRIGKEYFIDTLKRVGHEPFKAAANAARIPNLSQGEDVLHNPPGYARDTQEA